MGRSMELGAGCGCGRLGADWAQKHMIMVVGITITEKAEVLGTEYVVLLHVSFSGG